MVSLEESDLNCRKKYFDLKNKHVTEYHTTNCIYGLTNQQYKNYIKIGSTNNPQRRKYDYITSSPFKYEYLWIFYLKNFNYLICDEIIKLELKKFNIKYDVKNVGTEFYEIIDSNIICNILQKYNIEFELEIGDKFNNKIEIKNNNCINDTMDLKVEEFLSKFSTEQLEKIAEKAGINNNNIHPEIDITNYKYQYINHHLNVLKPTELNKIKCQSIDFFIERIKKNIKDICILGMIQSGKTNEILNLTFFCINILKIPVIIIIQNKTSGYKQLDLRFTNFIKQLKHYNFNIRYAKDLKCNKSLKIFNIDNPCPEVIIALSNYKQLDKINQHIENVKINNNNKIAPYALFMDEYDELIKSRSDLEDLEGLSPKDIKRLEQGKKKIEEYSMYIKNNSFINVGVTATLMAVMLTDNSLKMGDIFSLKPDENYVGFGSDRIKITDINEHLTIIKNKISIHINKLEYLIDAVDNSVDIDEHKDYSILLINVSDLSSVHNAIYDKFKNQFIEWSCIILNSKGEDGDIRCTLPNQYYSETLYETGTYSLWNDTRKTYTIDKNTEIIPKNHKLGINQTKEDREFFRYSISFSNCSISDIITKLMEFTNKVSIVSGKMACRGLSFVTNDYKKHITDMIYVPSGSASYTRNLQDMRIFGNFNDDGIYINLYTDAGIYNEDIKNYLSNQKKIINDGDVDKSCKENTIYYRFNPNSVPIKKLDRPGLTRGIKFNSDDKWGIPMNITDIEIAKKELNTKFEGYTIIEYSYHERHPLPNGLKYIPKRQKSNNDNMFSKLFKEDFKIILDTMFNTFGITKEAYTQSEIYNNYRNAWALHNPIQINRIDDVPDICYMGKEGGDFIDIIVRNFNYNSEELKKLIGTSKIILFYSRGCYHYKICDEQCYIIKDKYQITNSM